MKTKIILIAGIVLVSILSAVYAWFKPAQVVTQIKYVEVPKIRETVKIKTVKVPIKEIVTLEKEATIKALPELPQEVKDNPNKQITATAEIPPYEGVTNVVSITDTQSGKTEILAKRRPLPFFALTDEKEFGIRYGITTRGQQVDVFGNWNFARIGKIKIGLYLEANTKAEAKAMIQAVYKW